MYRKRILAILLAAAAFLPMAVSCSRIKNLRRTPEIIKYVNDEYHFSLTRPSYFSEIVEEPSEENKDEYRIELKNGEKDVITVDIIYKKAENIYEYAELYCPEKNRIIPLSSNHFAYDQRECPSYKKPAYYIFASTKRMLYIVKYEYEHGDENASKVVDSLKFEFDIYANLPKENAFLSPVYTLALGRLSIKMPADAYVKLYPNPDSVPEIRIDEETGKVIRPTVTAYTRILGISEKYFLSANVPFTDRFTREMLESDETDALLEAVAAELSDEKAVNIKFTGPGVKKENGKLSYRIINFSCLYNGISCSGSLTVGFTVLGKYFEYVYAAADDISEASFNNYNDMIHSINLY